MHVVWGQQPEGQPLLDEAKWLSVSHSSQWQSWPDIKTHLTPPPPGAATEQPHEFPGVSVLLKMESEFPDTDLLSPPAWDATAAQLYRLIKPQAWAARDWSFTRIFSDL